MTQPANDDHNLNTPAGARRYVHTWASRLLGQEATYVTTSENRLIHFKTMSDEDALWVAQQLKEMEETASDKRQD